MPRRNRALTPPSQETTAILKAALRAGNNNHAVMEDEGALPAARPAWMRRRESKVARRSRSAPGRLEQAGSSVQSDGKLEPGGVDQ